MNGAQSAVVDAYNAGYWVNDAGSVFHSNGDSQKTGTNDDGYAYFHLPARFARDKKQRQIHVHRLIAYLKFGERIFAPGIVVRHLDDTRSNTFPNIGIGTCLENSRDTDPQKRSDRARAREAAMSPEAKSERAKRAHGRLTHAQKCERARRSHETLGVEGRSKRTKAGAKTLGPEGIRIRNAKAWETRRRNARLSKAD